MTFQTFIFRDGEDDVVLLPDEASFGPDVDVALTRVGDVISVRPLSHENPSADTLEPISSS